MSNIVGIEHDRVVNTTATDFPGYSADGSNAWDLQTFKKQFDIKISYIAGRTANFDLIGVDSSIANAFRRIMIAEVPAVAAEYVYIFNNTSVIQDEVLSHRIGLIPLNVDPDMLTWVDPQAVAEQNFTDENTVVLTLDIECTKNPNAIEGNTEPTNLYKNSIVYAKDLKFEPHGRQKEIFKKGVKACDPDIVIAKLRPGQEISLKVHCVLGVGCDHAKFSPVATCSYRLLPVIDILKPMKGQEAKDFQKCFPSGVIGIDSKGTAFVEDARKDTVSREVLRHAQFDGKVKLGRKRDHFIFHIESTGAMSSEEIFFKSVRILRNKATYLRNCPIGNLN